MLYKLGDVVHHKYGQRMVIERNQKSMGDNRVQCSWFDPLGDFHREVFQEDELEELDD